MDNKNTKVLDPVSLSVKRNSGHVDDARLASSSDV